MNYFHCCARFLPLTVAASALAAEELTSREHALIDEKVPPDMVRASAFMKRILPHTCECKEKDCRAQRLAIAPSASV
jgi:hypothetical protein